MSMKLTLNILALSVFTIMTISVIAISLLNLRDYYDDISRNWKGLLVVNVLLYSSHILAYLFLSYKCESMYFSHHKISPLHLVMCICTFIVAIIMSMLKGYENIDKDMYYFISCWNWIYTAIQVLHFMYFAHSRSMLREESNGVINPAIAESEPVPEMPVKRLVKTNTVDLKTLIKEAVAEHQQEVIVQV